MTEQDKPQDTTSPTPEPSKERDRLAAYRGDLAGAERQASQVVSLGRQQVFMGLGMVGFFLSLFLPHSGKVLGLDVLFYSDTAQQYVTTVPERIYMWLALIAAVLLNAATLVTRSALIAYLTWFFSGAAMFYSVFAIWMRQSRPPTEPGVGPSFGLIIGTVSVSVVAAALSFVVLRRNSFQAALAEARREEKHHDHVAAVQEKILRMSRPPLRLSMTAAPAPPNAGLRGGRPLAENSRQRRTRASFAVTGPQLRGQRRQPIPATVRLGLEAARLSSCCLWLRQPLLAR